MCLLFVALRHFEQVPLLVAFNRDESLDRVTAPAHFWSDGSEVLAGRDMLKGGTWGGITRNGRVAFITFVRRKEKRKDNPCPRGEIVPAFLRNEITAMDYIEELRRLRTEHLGYNIVCGDVHELVHYSNASDRITRLEQGIHGISNALLNTPWPKVTRGTDALKKLDPLRVPDDDAVFRIITDSERAERHLLPRDTGMSEEKEWYRSSLFVDAPGYATRSSTVVRFKGDGSISLTERTHFPTSSEVCFRL